ncbi:shewanella-like protein phosphatase 2 [Typha latifolia]|uniref:shewanella-like protein phosphatase 2 n=1 Tax=Typha latifolia TaxID=4733 RepID=UPI003C2B3C7B
MESSDRTCSDLPGFVSSFVDAFVDFSVSGLFFPRNLNPSPPPTRLPATDRLVAIGDLHGDLPKALSALSLAGLVDPVSGRWTGGSAVAVQIGDIVDRGGDEIRLLYLLHRLKIEASNAGGALLTIVGNHEVMNVAGDFRYATAAALDEFKNWARWYRAGIAMKRLCLGLEPPKDPFDGIPKSFPGAKVESWEGIRARIAALRPSGPISTRFIAPNPTIAVVGDSVFVHGGLLHQHVRHGFEEINDEVRSWILGSTPKTPEYVRGQESVVWLRKFSDGPECDCGKLAGVLEMIPGARRMVMGHTIQTEGINAVCEDRAVRIDVGLSKGCGDGIPEVLEIIGGGKEMRVLTANPAFDVRNKEEGEGERRKEKAGLGWLVREGGTKQVEVKA